MPKIVINIPEKMFGNVIEDSSILVSNIQYLEFESLDQVLENIRSEIKEERECAYADFERYKVEYLGQDWEDAYDSLPQDDFRYGMERCLEIIDKHIGKEQK